MKKILPYLLLVMVLFLGFILWDDHRKNEQNMQEVFEYEEKLRPLSVKRQDLMKQLNNLTSSYEANRRPKATTQIIFTELDARVYELCYPIMKNYELAGVLALSSNALPGRENCMTMEQFQELLDAGWSTCVRFDNAESFGAQWSSLKNQLDTLGIAYPSTVYFVSGAYSTMLDTTLSNSGFSIVIHHGEESSSLLQANDESGIWHLGAVGLKGDQPRTRFLEAIEAKANIATLVGFTLEDEVYSENSFKDLVSSCKNYVINKELLVGSPEEARTHFQSRTVETGEAEKQAYLTEKARLEAELAEVEKQIEEVK